MHFYSSESGLVSKECLNEDQRTVQMKFIGAGSFPLPGLNMYSTAAGPGAESGNELVNENTQQV